MIDRGQRQCDIARALGVSIMTYHRWRKARPDIMAGAMNGVRREVASRRPPGQAEAGDIIRLDELRTENELLRRLVATLVLQKVRLEEAVRSRGVVGDSAPPRGYRRPASP
jgi:hypothetical protein